MLLAVLSGVILAVIAPLIYRLLGRHSGWAIALLPAGLFTYFAVQLGAIAEGGIVQQTVSWVPSLGVDLTFQLDGLSVIFAMLITGIGAFIMVFATGYLGEDENLPRFFVAVLLFMAAMLGLVLADNLILIFVFWELTSITSYVLIGYKHTKPAAQEAARRALIVTGLGGLAMLAGFILLGIAGGTLVVSELPAQREAIIQSPLYLPMLILIGLGAFTKSAQFPFHFWLPGAMEAPTPVSAYLHSATMVKAGVYLLARLSPSLANTTEWLIIVTTVGAITMLVAAYLAVQQVDLKRILAYSTVSALGIMVMLLGLGNEDAIIAALTFVVVHSLYKGAMFMAAGTIDHETGTRDVTELGGLWRVMPVLGGALLIAAISKAGLPPALGFHGKELIYYSTYEYTPLSGIWVPVLTGVAVIANALVAVSGWMVSIAPFFGEEKPTPKHPHAAPLSLVIGPVVLGITSLIAGAAPSSYSSFFIVPGVHAVLGQPVDFTLYYPTSVNEIVILSAVTIVLGIVGYVVRGVLVSVFGAFNVGDKIGPERIYGALYQGTLDFAEWITGLIQTGNMRQYVFTIVLTFAALLGATLIIRLDTSVIILPETLNIRFYELVLGIVIVVAVIMTVTTSNILVAIIGLGVVGYSVAMIFMLFSAPDLAMTQFAVETLSVILFVLVLYRLPDFRRLTPEVSRTFDIILSSVVGLLIGGMVFIVNLTPLDSQVAPYFLANSYPLALGQNVVNVILVDFRSMDTMGEITVIAVAAIGVFALLQLTPKEERGEHGSD